MKVFVEKMRFHSTDPVIFFQALGTSFVVGTILVLINQLSPLLNGGVTINRILQIGFTYLVPYCVSTFTAIRTQLRLEPDQEVPVTGTYKCEECTKTGRDHRISLTAGEMVPECPRFGRDTKFVLYREE